MYQKPVDVLSEFVANAWDADAENVDITLGENGIKIQDDGQGMTFNECQNFFLTVGRDRRKDKGKETSDIKARPVLGRKGIGKFAGFGIAKKIIVKSISQSNGELAKFEMDINEIIQYDAENNPNKPITLIKYEEPDANNIENHGTLIELIGIKVKSNNVEDFMKKLGRRFLLTQMTNDFKIKVNGVSLPDSFNEELEFSFPNDFTKEDKTKIVNFKEVDGWGVEKFKEYAIKWRIGFFESPIETEELRGISIFAKGKMAQKPFFFDISGGISGQMGLEYITGQVIMDFIDSGENDLIATERQRINLQTDLGEEIKAWGIHRIKLLSQLWKKKRSAKRLQILEDKLEGFSDRLDDLPGTERKTVKSVLLKIAQFERLGKRRFKEWCNDILTSWEKERLKELITKISETKDLDESQFLNMLSEADILTALNIAESVKTKILAIGELKQRVKSKQLENRVRDFIFEHPWIIHPKWERFQKERSVKKLIKELGIKNLDTEAFKGRVDLALSAGDQLLLLEFMRPGLQIDQDHLDRTNYYVMDIRNRLMKETGNPIKNLNAAYIVADSKKDSEMIATRIKQLEGESIFVMTWETLINQALKQWRDYLELLKIRNPQDKRIQDL